MVRLINDCIYTLYMYLVLEVSGQTDACLYIYSIYVSGAGSEWSD